jgi:hypothetical protein
MQVRYEVSQPSGAERRPIDESEIPPAALPDLRKLEQDGGGSIVHGDSIYYIIVTA